MTPDEKTILDVATMAYDIMATHAAGTWTNMMITVDPISSSKGVLKKVIYSPAAKPMREMMASQGRI